MTPALPVIRWIDGQKQVFINHNGQLTPVASFAEAVEQCRLINGQQ